MISPLPFRLFPNPRVHRHGGCLEGPRALLGRPAREEAIREIRSWPGYEPTPLRSLRGLASAAGLGEIHYKDEASRFGLGSFKALGGAYGVFRVLADEVMRRTGSGAVSSGDLREGRFREVVSEVVVTCATDGNHGRAVAWGASFLGCRAVIYLPEHVSRYRERAIAEHGAEVIRVPGSYDDAVRQADREAKEQGRIVVSDTSYPGYDEVPATIMRGYTLLVEEIESQIPDGPGPTHVFLQGGVGGLAAAVTAPLWEERGGDRPVITVVEPLEADGLFRSARRGAPAPAEGSLETVMAGLSCREVSPLAWQVLERGADAFQAVTDSAATETMRLLARGAGGDPPVVGGESGVAGLAGLLQAALEPDARGTLGLGEASRVLVLGTEGATDPEVYRRIVGRDPADVMGGDLP